MRLNILIVLFLLLSVSISAQSSYKAYKGAAEKDPKFMTFILAKIVLFTMKNPTVRRSSGMHENTILNTAKIIAESWKEHLSSKELFLKK